MSGFSQESDLSISTKLEEGSTPPHSTTPSSKSLPPPSSSASSPSQSSSYPPHTTTTTPLSLPLPPSSSASLPSHSSYPPPHSLSSVTSLKEGITEVRSGITTSMIMMGGEDFSLESDHTKFRGFERTHTSEFVPSGVIGRSPNFGWKNAKQHHQKRSPLRGHIPSYHPPPHPPHPAPFSFPPSSKSSPAPLSSSKSLPPPSSSGSSYPYPLSSMSSLSSSSSSYSSMPIGIISSKLSLATLSHPKTSHFSPPPPPLSSASSSASSSSSHTSYSPPSSLPSSSYLPSHPIPSSSSLPPPSSSPSTLSSSSLVGSSHSDYIPTGHLKSSYSPPKEYKLETSFESSKRPSSRSRSRGTSPSRPVTSVYTPCKPLKGVAAFVVKHEPVSFELDLYITPDQAANYATAITNEYSFQNVSYDPETLKPIHSSIETRTAYRCRIRRVQVLTSPGQALDETSPARIITNSVWMEITRIINQTNGWLRVDIYDIDVHRRLLVDLFDPISGQDLKQIHLDPKNKEVYVPYSTPERRLSFER